MTVGPALTRGYTVQIRGENDKPVADAVLLCLSYATDGYSRRLYQSRRRYPGDEPKHLAARALLGMRLPLDEDGATRIPREERGLILAVHEGRIAAASHSESTRKTSPHPATLTLRPPVTAKVRVLQANGQPAAAVPVGIMIGSTVSIRAVAKRDGSTR